MPDMSVLQMDSNIGVITYEFKEPMPVEGIFEDPKLTGLVTDALGNVIELVVASFFEKAVQGPEGIAAATLALGCLRKAIVDLQGENLASLASRPPSDFRM